MHVKLASGPHARRSAPRNRAVCRVAVALTLAAFAIYAPVITTYGSTMELDALTRSPGAILFDADANVETRSNYVNGSISAEARGPFVGTNINALIGAAAFYDHGYTGTNTVIANIE